MLTKYSCFGPAVLRPTADGEFYSVSEVDALLAEPAVSVSELDVRDRIVTFIMEHYNDTPEDGHFWFDIHDAVELLEEIDKAKGGA